MIEWYVNVPVCDEHWLMLCEDRGQEGRVPVRVRVPEENCIKCGEPADIWVRGKLELK